MTPVPAFVLLGLALGAGAAGWFVPTRSRLQVALAAAAVGCLVVVGAVVWWGDAAAWSAGHRDTLVFLSAVLAVAGGGPATTAVFRLVDGRRADSGRDTVTAAGLVLRGGAWIGGLERAAVFATVVAGWPEGLAVVLALKGLARYPELRGPSELVPSAGGSPPPLAHGVAERFIIGTFVSVLWAVACAGLAVA